MSFSTGNTSVSSSDPTVTETSYSPAVTPSVPTLNVCVVESPADSDTLAESPPSGPASNSTVAAPSPLPALRTPAVTVSVSPTVTGAFVAEIPTWNSGSGDSTVTLVVSLLFSLATVSVYSPPSPCPVPTASVSDRDPRSSSETDASSLPSPSAPAVTVCVPGLSPVFSTAAVTVSGSPAVTGVDTSVTVTSKTAGSAGSGRCAVMLSVRPS